MALDLQGTKSWLSVSLAGCDLSCGLYTKKLSVTLKRAQVKLSVYPPGPLQVE